MASENMASENSPLGMRSANPTMQIRIQTYPRCWAAKSAGGGSSEPPPAEIVSVRPSAYFKLAAAVRSALKAATILAPHQFDPNPPGLIGVKLPVNMAVWSLVKALQSPLFKLVW
jgi:hypothetical protein